MPDTAFPLDSSELEEFERLAADSAHMAGVEIAAAWDRTLLFFHTAFRVDDAETPWTASVSELERRGATHLRPACREFPISMRGGALSVEVRSVVKRFGAHAAVNDVTTSVEDGEFFVVLGPSGCGKSTLLRLIAGLDRVNSGSIALDGLNASGPDCHIPPEGQGPLQSGPCCSSAVLPRRLLTGLE